MKHELTQSSSQCNSQVLLPIAALLPPNEIISKAYSPDVKPTFKLMQQMKQKKRSTVSAESKTNYPQQFSQADTLGFEYNRKLKHNLVFLKMDNFNHMRLSNKSLCIKYLAGIFIPLDQLLKPELKRTKSIFKIIDSLQIKEVCMGDVRFTSNYQSGNLFAAFKNTDHDYDLVLQNDINSRGNNQWFNFTVQLPQRSNFKFNIVNLTKSGSLYKQGMTVVLHSRQERRVGWQRGGHSITYAPNAVLREGSQSTTYYTLHFQYYNPYPTDTVTFSYCFPYTSFQMDNFFNRSFMHRIVHSLVVEKQRIGQTLSGFPIYAYCIKAKKLALSSSQFEDQLKSVVFLARQHPGQSQSSYVLQGIAQFLLQNNQYDAYKRNFIFYLIPMVNIDGVHYGNYRTNLSGNDLNRVWRHPHRSFHSQITAIKKALFTLNRTTPISLVLDIHGHSNSLNSFFYGNPPRRELPDNPRLFPYFCSRKVKQISFEQCTFSISEDKKNCARVVLGEMFPRALVYTFQNSFFGWVKGKKVMEHTINSYRKLGKQVTAAYLEYCKIGDKNPILKDKWLKDIEEQAALKNNCANPLCDSDDEVESELVHFVPENYVEEDTPRQYSRSPRNTNESKKYRSYQRILTWKNIKQKKTDLSAGCKYQNTNVAQTTVEKINECNSDSQGFLSIVKINTRKQIVTSKTLEEIKEGDAPKRKQEMRKSVKDVLRQKISWREKRRGDIQIGVLVNEKEMAMEKLRKKRIQMNQSLDPRTYQSFLKTVMCFDKRRS